MGTETDPNSGANINIPFLEEYPSDFAQWISTAKEGSVFWGRGLKEAEAREAMGLSPEETTTERHVVAVKPKSTRLGAKRPSSFSAETRAKMDKGLSKSYSPVKDVKQKSVQMKAENSLGNWLINKDVGFSFESDLLGGRLELNGIQASFIFNNHAVRFFDQPDSMRTMDKAVLESSGYNVIDIAPSQIYQADRAFNNALSEYLPRKGSKT